MILATHAIVGAAAAQFFPNNPILAFIAAFASHFLLDAIPRWNYPLRSYKDAPPSHPLDADMSDGKTFIMDLFHIGIDALIGTLLSILFFSLPSLSADRVTLTLIGAIGGMIPDALQFAYWKLRIEPLQTLQRFHRWIHTKREWEDKPFLGIMLQAILILIIVSATKLILKQY